MMFKKTAIALGLAIVTGSAFAADAGMSSASGADTDMQASGSAQGGASSNSALAARFKQLDTNGDGTLSRSEALASQQVSSMYDSLNTNETIEKQAKKPGANGITLDQFEAGMQAAQNGGVVGDSVSGGGTYTVMKNGARKVTHVAGEAAGGVRHKMAQAGNMMSGAGHSMMHEGRAAGSHIGNGMSDMKHGAMSHGKSMGSHMHNGMTRMREGAGNMMSSPSSNDTTKTQSGDNMSSGSQAPMGDRAGNVMTPQTDNGMSSTTDQQ